LRNIKECFVGRVQECSFGENGTDVVNHAQIIAQFFGCLPAEKTKSNVDSWLGFSSRSGYSVMPMGLA
jgi:hypothetical protein